ncbi:SpoIID/LytB domain-containing protein [candidate division KSB1 bacterium]
MKKVFLLIISFNLFFCAALNIRPSLKRTSVSGEPLISVKLPFNTKSLTVSDRSGFWVKDSNTSAFFDEKELNVFLSVQSLPVYEYILIFGKYRSYENAVEYRNRISKKNGDLKIEKTGEFDFSASGGIRSLTFYTITSESFRDLKSMTDFRIKNNLTGELRRKISTSGRGRIIITSGSRTVEFSNPVFIYPRNRNDVFSVKDKSSENGSQNYSGFIRLDISETGDFSIINQLDLENYVQGVVANEMNPEWHTESLKAQAVLSRTLAYKKILRTTHKAGFDISDSELTQVFSGNAEINSNVIDAVSATTGLVILHNDALADILFSACCGGVMSAASDYWSGSNPVINENTSDNYSKSPEDLSDETGFRKWMNKRGGHFCSSEKIEKKADISWEKSLYRWETLISALEIQNNITQYFSNNTGRIIDVLISERYRSGNIKKVRIVGTFDNIDITDPIIIRRVFRAKSAKFYVEKTGNNIQFKLIGAGSGHGAGICQLGALGMALDGFNYDEIIKHYLKNVSIIRAY